MNDRSGFVPSAFHPHEAPTFEDVMHVLYDLHLHGSQVLHREEAEYRQTNPEEWASHDQLEARLEGEERELFMLFEERSNYLGAIWGNDQFRIGFALGASLGRWFDSAWPTR